MKWSHSPLIRPTSESDKKERDLRSRSAVLHHPNNLISPHDHAVFAVKLVLAFDVTADNRWVEGLYLLETTVLRAVQ